MTAQKLDSLLRILEIKGLNSESIDDLSKERLNKLYELLDRIKPLKEDDYKVLYFSVKKGENGDYDDYKDFDDDIYWYKMVTTKYNEYYMISINSQCVLYTNINDKVFFENSQLKELLEFLIKKVKECIKKLEDGTYNEYINDNYSYENKFGVIKRKDYWKTYPEIKEYLLEEITNEEIDYFLKNATSNEKKRINNMTSGKYFEYVYLIYKSLNYEIGNLSNKELYLKYADGRDMGLSEIDESSSVEFEKWLNDNTKFGGHPYEIIPGHSFSRINLFIRKDELGYYLSINGRNLIRKIEIVKIFNILHKNNIPLNIYDVDVIKESLKGNDYIGIVPSSILPIYCEEYFKKYKPLEFIHMKDKKMLKHIKWEDLEIIELK